MNGWMLLLASPIMFLMALPGEGSQGRGFIDFLGAFFLAILLGSMWAVPGYCAIRWGRSDEPPDSIFSFSGKLCLAALVSAKQAVAGYFATRWRRSDDPQPPEENDKEEE